nr:MMPL family transporter [Mycobacterium stomatepiae]
MGYSAVLPRYLLGYRHGLCTNGSSGKGNVNVASDLRSIGWAGSTIGRGLLFDTLMVRSLMTPSIAALLGRWFCWPIRVHPRPTGCYGRSDRVDSSARCFTERSPIDRRPNIQ